MLNNGNLLLCGMLIIIPLGIYKIFNQNASQKQMSRARKIAMDDEHERRMVADLERIRQKRKGGSSWSD